MNTTKILLQSYDLFDVMADCDPQTKTLDLWSKQNNPQKLSGPVQGHFYEIDQQILILYRGQEGSLHFVADDLDIILNEETLIEFIKGSRNKLSIFREAQKIVEIEYRPKTQFPGFDIDPTPFIEEEDFDFGLFVYNIFKDKGRRDRIYRG